MSFTKASGSRTRTTTKSDKEEGVELYCKCNPPLRASRKFSSTAKNPNRWFYACGLHPSDPDKCKFFKWEDELDIVVEHLPAGTPIKSGRGRTLGASPNSLDSVVPEIDWSAVDPDSLEEAALSAHPTPTHSTPGKRKRQEDNTTPRKQTVTPSKTNTNANPFVTPRGTTPTTPSRFLASAGSTSSVADESSHPALAPVFLSLEGLGEHLARQDRLVRAAEAMKKSMRQTIQNLQERVRVLEAENAELRKG